MRTSGDSAFYLLIFKLKTRSRHRLAKLRCDGGSILSKKVRMMRHSDSRFKRNHRMCPIPRKRMSSRHSFGCVKKRVSKFGRFLTRRKNQRPVRRVVDIGTISLASFNVAHQPRRLLSRVHWRSAAPLLRTRCIHYDMPCRYPCRRSATAIIRFWKDKT